MCDELYNGWSNRETWALNLWLSNDEGLFSLGLEWTRDAVSEYGWDSFGMIGEHVESMARELCDEFPEGLRGMRDDVGSWWRVNVREIGRAWVANVAEADEWGTDETVDRMKMGAE